ncbi:hypothetical protein L484_009219 [Morus notabilis]|uniref:Uncharacterized protein n=1 Tax=Morus notabilis TaxID=981085 RepID=W9RVA0_9ROSA|nr:hypothetical protein L484_009219 [Morus notabilis]
MEITLHSQIKESEVENDVSAYISYGSNMSHLQPLYLIQCMQAHVSLVLSTIRIAPHVQSSNERLRSCHV